MHTVGSVCSSDVRISERVRKETNGVVLSRDRASEKPDPPGVNNGWDLIRHFGRGSPHLWRLVIRVSRAVVHGRIKTVKTEYSEDELPLDRDFAAVLLDWRARGPKSELVFPSHITGRHFHASPIQQDYIRPAGCCLVVCPKCSAQIGAWCQDRAGKHVEVHEGRWASAGPFSRVGWHTFRHTYRSWLDSTGAPLGVQQKLMRHAQISTTMNVYGNALMASKRDANSKVAKLALGRGYGPQEPRSETPVN